MKTALADGESMFSQQKLDLQNIKMLSVQGRRGVAIVTDMTNRLCVLDLEAGNDDDAEDDEDEDEDEEEDD